MSNETFIPFELHMRSPEDAAWAIALKMTEAQREIQRLSGRLSSLKSKLESAVEDIKETAKIKQTGWFVLLKRDGDGWACVGFENPNLSTGGEEEKEWDLILPIPEPSTVPEFAGH